MMIRIASLVLLVVSASGSVFADPESKLLERFRKERDERPQAWKERIDKAIDLSKELEKDQPERAADSLRRLIGDVSEESTLSLDTRRDLAKQLRQRLDDLLFSTLLAIPRGPGVIVGRQVPPDPERLDKEKTGEPAIALLYDGTIFPLKSNDETRQTAELNYISSRWVLLTLNYRKTWFPAWQINAVHVPQGTYIYDYDYLYFRFVKNSMMVDMSLGSRNILIDDYPPPDDSSAKEANPLLGLAFRTFPETLRPTPAQLRRAMKHRMGLDRDQYVPDNMLLNRILKYRPDYASDALLRALPKASPSWLETARHLHAEYIDVARDRRELTELQMAEELTARIRRSHPTITRDEAERMSDAIIQGIANDRRSRPR
ncbi:MAG: hypothetical protein U0744_16385 [Gemmataceae bacterium]